MPDTPPIDVPITDRLAGLTLGGRYRLERRIASGGMASVWEAADEVLARQVAVKVLHAHLAADATFVARFRREAVAAARLTHPSIVSIYDTVSDSNGEAIVMELVRGTTLRGELDRRGRFDPGDAAAVVIAIADALAAAHAGGIVHRDMKPANVLLSSDGRVLVADFGIAKAGDGLDLTGTNTTLGTAKYLAPEQVEGAPVDARADVYALGVILYELVCGQPPFIADTEAATALARLHRDPESPRLVCPTLPEIYETVILRALARRPDDRYVSATALRDAVSDASRAAAATGFTAADPDTPRATAAAVAVDATRAEPGALPNEWPATDATTAGPSQTAPAHAAPLQATTAGPTVAKQPHRRRRWLPGLLIVAPVLAGVLVALLLVVQARDDSDNDPGSSANGLNGALAVAGLASFDPIGSGGENDGDLPTLTDANPSTQWQTEGYNTRAFGGLKDGVGVLIELSEATDLDRLVVDSPTDGWAAEVYVVDEPGGHTGRGAPDGWGEPIDAEDGIGAGTVEFDLDGRSGRFVLLFITDLGTSPPRVKVEITDLALS